MGMYFDVFHSFWLLTHPHIKNEATFPYQNSSAALPLCQSTSDQLRDTSTATIIVGATCGTLVIPPKSWRGGIGTRLRYIAEMFFLLKNPPVMTKIAMKNDPFIDLAMIYLLQMVIFHNYQRDFFQPTHSHLPIYPIWDQHIPTSQLFQKICSDRGESKMHSASFQFPQMAAIAGL